MLNIQVFKTARDVAALAWQDNQQSIRLVFILSLIFGIAPSLGLWIGKLLIDYFTQAATLGYSSYLMLLLAAVVALQLISISLGSWINMLENNLREKLAGDVQTRILQSVNRQKGLAFFENPKNIDALELAKTAQERIGRFVFMLSTVLNALIPLLSVLILAATLAWWIPLLLCVTIAPAAYIKYRTDQGTWQAERDLAHFATHMRQQENMLLLPNFIKDVRLFNIGQWLVQNWQAKFLERYHAIVTIRQKGTRRFLYSSVLNTAGVVFCYLYVIHQVIKGQLSVGDLAMFMGLFQNIRSNLLMIIGGSSNLMQTLSSLQPLSYLLNLPDDLPLQQPSNKENEKGIVLAGVSFGYGDKPILKNINLHIKKGEMVVIVGANGAGKTTLVKLLCRFYDPDEGMIRLDGQNIASLELTEYRNHLAVVSQDFARFPLSLRDNLVFGAEEDIAPSLQKVGLAEVVAQLPAASDTALSREIEGGSDLSGGQWQRVAIARALQRQDANIMILDEPTAALDPNTEKEIFELFRDLAAERTAIIVSHRMSMASQADTIVVMAAGEIVEVGTHQELMRQQGHYHIMFQNQAENYQANAKKATNPA